jgi:serine/threonine-protein kinase
VTHPSEETLLGMLDATLEGAARLELEAHLDTCASCRAVVAELARDDSAAQTQLSQPSLVAADPRAFDPGSRYELKSRLGQGGMGEVYLAKDRMLNRDVALKRVRPSVAGQVTRELFLREAQIAAQLEHPNILSIHDIVVGPGEPFFTMKYVRGSTLQHVLDRLAQNDPVVAERHGPMRLGIMFLQVVQAIAHAHARGVVHCDLKPANLLVGEYGEVLVTDWGLARVSGPSSVQLHFTPKLTGGGTALYMSPEQAASGEVDTRADVYGLGAVMYALLTLEAPHPHGALDQTLQKVQAGAVVPPRQRAPRRDISEELEQVCLKALAVKPEDRFQSAAELAEATEAFLTGARRRQQARVRHDEGAAALKQWEQLNEKAAALEGQRADLARRVRSYEPEDVKAPLWRLEEELDRVQGAAEHALALALDGFSQAAGTDPSYAEPADGLAKLHLELFLEAEAQGDRRGQELHGRALERHHRGQFADVLEGRGTLAFDVKEPGVTIEAVRLVERGKKIVPGHPLKVDRVPASPLSLSRGSYLFVLKAPGRAAVRLHVFVDRGSALTIPVRFFDDAQVGEGFVHVPAGPFVYGGDRVALNAAPRQVVSLPDVFIARFPVTCEQYLTFLNDLPLAEAARHVPRTKPDGGYLWERQGGRFVLPEVDADGNPGVLKAPVMGVSFDDATRYAAWKSERERARYRLPTEHEWEKAARGADGRFFPWGNGFDASFCKMALSRAGRPLPEPVGAFPVDTSIYGMQDCAGAIREWCDAWYDEAHQTRVLRGGAWYFNAHYCRLAFRHGYLPHIVFTNFGIRLAKDL